MFLTKLGATAAVGAALVLAAGPALAAAGWTIVTAPPTGVNASLTGVTSTSDSDAWAVGSENAALNGVGAKVLIDHWNGTAWSQVATPVTPGNTASLAGQIGAGVTDISPTDAYAIGGGLGSASTGLVAQWNGTTWTRLTVPQPSTDGLASNLDAISADGPNDVWIVGTYTDEISPTFFPTETYALHWNGTAWSVVSIPLVGSSNVNAFFHFNAIKADSPTDVWAVGDQGIAGTTTGSTLIEHWNGTAWSVVPSPSPGSGSDLTGVATTPGAAIVQAVGFSGSSGAENPLAERSG